MLPREGTIVADRYRLERKVGGGRVAATWQVFDEQTQGLGVLKLLHRSMHHHPEALRRFSLEAQIARELNGPYFAERLDSGSWQSLRYIAWRWHQGECLRTRFERNPKQDAPTVCAVVKDVCEALNVVHAAGYAHADLKPENVFFAESEKQAARAEGEKEAGRQLKLLGFGVSFPEEPRQGGAAVRSQERRRWHVVGTPLYMSPDMLRGDVPIGGKVDLWSLAVIVYEALTGRVPFLGSDLEETLAAIVARRAPRPSTLAEVPASIDSWWAQAVAQEFTTAREFAGAVVKALEPALKSSRTQRSKLSPPSNGELSPSHPMQPTVSRAIDVLPNVPEKPQPSVSPPAASQNARPPFTPLPSAPTDFLSSAKRTLVGIKPAQLDNKPRATQLNIEASPKVSEAVTLYRNIEISEPKEAIAPANDHRTVPFSRPQLVPLGGFTFEKKVPKAVAASASANETPPRSSKRTVEQPRPAFLAGVGVERKHQLIAAGVVCFVLLVFFLFTTRMPSSGPAIEQTQGALKQGAPRTDEHEPDGFLRPFGTRDPLGTENKPAAPEPAAAPPEPNNTAPVSVQQQPAPSVAPRTAPAAAPPAAAAAPPPHAAAPPLAPAAAKAAAPPAAPVQPKRANDLLRPPADATTRPKAPAEAPRQEPGKASTKGDSSRAAEPSEFDFGF
jgi:eukaryotic-like serine/threonine-protein kinase